MTMMAMDRAEVERRAAYRAGRDDAILHMIFAAIAVAVVGLIVYSLAGTVL